MVWIVRRLQDALCPLLDWFWRRLALIWRCLVRSSAAIRGRARLALGFGTSGSGCQGETETSPAAEPEEVAAEGGHGEGLHEAEAGTRPARQRFESDEAQEGEYTEEDEEGEEDKYKEEDEEGEEDKYKEEDEEGEEDKYQEEDEGSDLDSEECRVETTDEFYCDYDSTWETEEGPIKRAGNRAPSRHYMFNRFRNAAKDMQNYRHGYPLQNRPEYRDWTVSLAKPNLEFYLGKRPSSPDGVYISNFHNEWFGEYDTLEYVHSYIQWLFPLQEPGMNRDAIPLTQEEVEDFKYDPIAKENLLKSYKLMLDFYGIQLCNEDTGDVGRASNWRDRFNNLNSHSHNNLRITRILKCLGTLGYSHYQVPLVRFFLEETLVHGQLPRVKDSVLCYFVFAVLNKRQRRNLIKFAFLKYDSKDEFVWCPKKVQKKWSKSKEDNEAVG